MVFPELALTLGIGYQDGNKKSFKRKVKEEFFDLLESQDSYIDVLIITSKIENHDMKGPITSYFDKISLILYLVIELFI